MVRRDPKRLTALAGLAIREADDFPRIFYYADSADMALDANDIDWETVSHCRSVLIGGSYLAATGLRAMSMQLAKFAQSRGIRAILDIDFRPVLWGLATHDEGNRMSAKSADEDQAQIQMLCDAYEKSDRDGRKMIQLFAQLSIVEGEGIEPGRFQP